MSPIGYLNPDCIVTWSILRLFYCSNSFTCCQLMCDLTNLWSVAIWNRWLSDDICHCFIVIQTKFDLLEIGELEVRELLILGSPHIDHVMIWLQPKYLIASQVVRTIKWNRSSVSPLPKTCRLRSAMGTHLVLVSRWELLGGSWPGLRGLGQFWPRPKPGVVRSLVTLLVTANCMFGFNKA